MSDHTGYVLGAGIAGLLAAKTLSTKYDKVVILERDTISLDSPEYRKGVAQSMHSHILLKHGLDCIEALVPGFTEAVLANGGIKLDAAKDWAAMFPMGWFLNYDSGISVICASRVLLEHTLRTLVLKDNNIILIDNASIEELKLFDDKPPIVCYRDASNALIEVKPSCVINALGRNARTLQWLNSSGFGPFKEESISSYLSYSSRFYENIHFPEGVKACVIFAKDPDFPNGGIIYPIEEGKFLMTLYGLGDNAPPDNEEGFVNFAKGLRSDLLFKAISDATPVSPIKCFIKKENTFTHYGAGKHWPYGFLVLGDALCSPNPVYGQGITAAAIAAKLLKENVNFDQNLIQYQKKITKGYAITWLNAKNEDLRWPSTESSSGTNVVVKLLHRFMNRVLYASSVDRDVNYAFIKVLHMIASPTILFQPKILFKIFKHSPNDNSSK